MIKEANKGWIEKVLNTIPFVKWDRCIEVYNQNQNYNVINIFGWIDREDSYKDFVDLEFDLNEGKVYFISTSSKKYSKKIAEIIGSRHFPCCRVEDIFKIENSISLSKTMEDL